MGGEAKERVEEMDLLCQARGCGLDSVTSLKSTGLVERSEFKYVSEKAKRGP